MKPGGPPPGLKPGGGNGAPCGNPGGGKFPGGGKPLPGPGGPNPGAPGNCGGGKGGAAPPTPAAGPYRRKLAETRTTGLLPIN